jgi:hypothetical protein
MSTLSPFVVRPMPAFKEIFRISVRPAVPAEPTESTATSMHHHELLHGPAALFKVFIGELLLAPLDDAPKIFAEHSEFFIA